MKRWQTWIYFHSCLRGSQSTSEQRLYQDNIFFFFFTIKQSGEKRSNPGQENGEINDVKLFSQVLLGFVCTVGAR